MHIPFMWLGDIAIGSGRFIMISTDSTHLKLVRSFFDSGSGASTAAFGIPFLGPAAAVMRDG
jgi:hypothetical protein